MQATDGPEQLLVTVDGQSGTTFAPGETLVVRRAEGAEAESQDVQTAAGTWVYFPDVIPEPEDEFDAGLRDLLDGGDGTDGPAAR